MDITVSDVEANGMTFRCRTAGDSGDPVMLLHGFPETSHMWTDLIPRLAEAGYRTLAPDLRGYSPGARPDDVSAYSYEALASDVFALADASGFERFHLVGHDWGAIIGWAAVDIDGGKRIASWTSDFECAYVELETNRRMKARTEANRVLLCMSTLLRRPLRRRAAGAMCAPFFKESLSRFQRVINFVRNATQHLQHTRFI